MEKEYKNPLDNRFLRLCNQYSNNSQLIIQDRIFENEQESVQGENIENAVFKNVKFINCDLAYVGFANCLFENCYFEDVDFGGFGSCKFENCTFDKLGVSHNSGFIKCQFNNSQSSKRQYIINNINPTFSNTDFSEQENLLMINNCVKIEHGHFVNCKIDLKTIKKMASKCDYFWYTGYPENLCKSKVGKDKYSEPRVYFYAQNASVEVKMNFILAVLTHDICFEIDNSDTSLDFLPMKVNSSLKKEAINIVDDEGKQIDLTKIIPFDLDLISDGFVGERKCDLSIYNEKIQPNQWCKEQEAPEQN